MIKRIERYFLKDISGPFFLGLLVYTATLLINNILRLAKLLISRGVSFDVVVNLLFLMLPDMFAFTIPMSVLLGVIAGLSRMSSDSEILAMKTLGFSYWRIIRPILAFSLLATVATAFITMEIAPDANYQLNILLNRVAASQSVVDIKAGIFYNDLPFMNLFVREIGQGGEWRDILLYIMKDPRDDVLITARRGKIINYIQLNQSYLLLYNGVIHTYKKTNPQEYTLTYFQEKREKIERGNLLNPPRRYSQLKWKQLLAERQKDPQNILLETEFHNKLALPAACLILGFLALPLGINTRRGGKSSGFVISLIIILIYYILLTSGRNFILEKHFPPWFGVWFANLFILVSALILNLMLALEIPLNTEKLSKLFSFHRKKENLLRQQNILLKIKFELPRLQLFKTLTLYVLKRLFLFFALFFLALLFIYYLILSIDLLDDAIENKSPLINIVYYNYHLTPEIVLSIVPIALLAAVLITFSLMSKNNELTTIKVSGINPYRLFLPAIVFALLISVGCLLIQETILPTSSSISFYYYNRIHNRQSTVEREFQRNWLFADQQTVIFYQFFEKKNNRFTNFNLLYFDQHLNLSKRIYADFARLEKNQIIVNKGFQREWDRTSDDQFLPKSFSRFQEKQIPTMLKLEDFFKKESFSAFMNISQQKKYIEYLRSRQSDVTRYRSQLYFNYLYPFTTFILVLIALPFSFMMGKKGTLAGMGIAVFIAVSYWTLLGVFNSLGAIGAIPPLLANLIIPIIYSAFSIIMIVRLPR